MLHAPFLLARRVLPGMYARGWGRLVHVSSVHGHRASAYKSAYVSAKHGLEGLSKVIALEAADKGVTSNTVCPGYVRTPLVEGQLTDQARAHGIAEDEVLDSVLLARTPVKRLVEPEEVADAVAFLCSPAATSTRPIRTPPSCRPMSQACRRRWSSPPSATSCAMRGSPTPRS